MKPRLVKHLFHTETPKPVIKPMVQSTIQPKPIIIHSPPVDYTPLIINLVSILLMIIGGFALYYRKENQKKNKENYVEKIQNLHKEINLNNIKHK